MNITKHQNRIDLVKVFWITSVSLIAFSLLYMYFIGQTIFAAAERESIESNLIEVQTNISELELSLIDHRRAVTREYATELGFVEVDETVFVKRDPTTRLSLRNQ